MNPLYNLWLPTAVNQAPFSIYWIELWQFISRKIAGTNKPCHGYAQTQTANNGLGPSPIKPGWHDLWAAHLYNKHWQKPNAMQNVFPMVIMVTLAIFLS